MPTITLDANSGGLGLPNYPCSLVSDWKTVLVATYLDDQDQAGAITRPDNLSEDRNKFRRGNGHGTILRIRMQYDDGAGIATKPKIIVFGRVKDTSNPYQPIRNQQGDYIVTITDDATNDVQDGTNSYTTPGIDAHSWDCDGFDEFIIGVQTAIAGSGDVTTALLQGRFI